MKRRLLPIIITTMTTRDNHGGTGPLLLGAENRAEEEGFREEEKEPKVADLPKVTQSGKGGSLLQF